MASKKRILLVEDDMIISLVIEKIVQRLGLNVVHKVTSGEDAVKTALEHQPDLILMDIRLNGTIDGIEAMKKIKSHSDIPVVYITGNADRTNRERAREIGYHDFLTKPINQMELSKSINRLFNNQNGINLN